MCLSQKSIGCVSATAVNRTFILEKAVQSGLTLSIKELLLSAVAVGTSEGFHMANQLH